MHLTLCKSLAAKKSWHWLLWPESGTQLTWSWEPGVWPHSHQKENQGRLAWEQHTLFVQYDQPPLAVEPRSSISLMLGCHTLVLYFLPRWTLDQNVHWIHGRPSNISVQRQDCSARGFLRCQFWFCSSGWWWCGSRQLTIIWNPAMMTHFSQTDVFPWPGFCPFPGSTLFGRLLIPQRAPSKPWFDSPLDPNVHLNVIHSVLSPE